MRSRIVLLCTLWIFSVRSLPVASSEGPGYYFFNATDGPGFMMYSIYLGRAYRRASVFRTGFSYPIDGLVNSARETLDGLNFVERNLDALVSSQTNPDRSFNASVEMRRRQLDYNFDLFSNVYQDLMDLSLYFRRADDYGEEEWIYPATIKSSMKELFPYLLDQIYHSGIARTERFMERDRQLQMEAIKKSITAYSETPPSERVVRALRRMFRPASWRRFLRKKAGSFAKAFAGNVVMDVGINWGYSQIEHMLDDEHENTKNTLAVLVNKTVTLDEQLSLLRNVTLEFGGNITYGANFTGNNTFFNLKLLKIRQQITRAVEFFKIDEMFDLTYDKLRFFQSEIGDLYRIKDDLRNEGCYEVMVRSGSLKSFAESLKAHLDAVGLTTPGDYAGDLSQVSCKRIKSHSPIEFSAQIPLIRDRRRFYQVYSVKLSPQPQSEIYSKVLDHSDPKPYLAIRRLSRDDIGIIALDEAQVKNFERMKDRETYFFSDDSEELTFVPGKKYTKEEGELICLASFILGRKEDAETFCKYKTVPRVPRVVRLAPNFVSFDTASSPGALEKTCDGEVVPTERTVGTMYLAPNCDVRISASKYYGSRGEKDVFMFGYPYQSQQSEVSKSD